MYYESVVEFLQVIMESPFETLNDSGKCMTKVNSYIPMMTERSRDKLFNQIILLKITSSLNINRFAIVPSE